MPSFGTAIHQLAGRLRILRADDSPQFDAIQRARAWAYMADGALTEDHLTADGRYVMPEDAGAVHFCLDDPPSGGIFWLKAQDRNDVGWGGGWWTSRRSQLLDGPLLILLVLAQSIRAGCRYGWSTVTHRHKANELLLHLGARFLYLWSDPDYNCPIDWVEFDFQALPPRYAGFVHQIESVIEEKQCASV